MLLLIAHRAHRLAAVAAVVVVVRGDIARIEVQTVGVARAARAERARPVVAVGTCVVERRTAATPGGRQENAVPVRYAPYLEPRFSLYLRL